MKNKKGFTLVEVVVVCSIIAILLATTVISLSAYYRYAQFKRRNDYAAVLFNAAQMQMVAYGQSGRLPKLEQASAGNDVPILSLTGQDGSAITPSSIWQTKESAYQGRLCYLMGTSEDYRAYIAGDRSDIGKTALYDLFDVYLYDKSVLNAAICVEFDPTEGLVYSVFYGTERFSYTDGEYGTVSIANRTDSVRKAELVGYYGAEILSKTADT